MIRDLLKWVAPGLVTILAGTTLTLAMSAPDIARDVATQTTAAMQRAGFDWAELSFSMRDLTLSGTTTDQRNIEAARERLARIAGLRSVDTNVTLAPMAAPYRLEARLADGEIALTGGVPDQTTRQMLLARADLEQGALELRSGMPERRAWIAGAQFAIDQLRFFDQGQSTLSDLTLDISGRAKSARDFRDLLIVLRAGAPAGVTLGAVDITPALVSPYQWSASSDGKRIEISGFVPDETLAERYRMAATGGLSVATGLALGSGEPEDFADISQLLIEQLSTLEYGTASIIDGQSTLTGAPPTEEVAQAVTENLAPAGSIVTLEPPRIADYWVSATLQPGGTLVFDGYAPDAATRDGLTQHPGADTAWLKLGRGAPERYQSAMDFGLAALQQMSEGRFALRQNVMTLSGVAQSSEDYLRLLTVLAEDAPQGLVLARAEIAPPAASPYQWSAIKAPSGDLTLSGMVPSPEIRAALLSAAGSSSSATLAYASGEPRNFMASAETGLALLAWLEQGEVRFDGSGWTVTGSARSAIDKAAIEADFVSRKLAAAGWSMAIAAVTPTAPEAPVATSEPAVPAAADPVSAEPVAADAPPPPTPEPATPAVPTADSDPAVPASAPVAPAPLAETSEAPEPAAIDAAYAFSADRAEDGAVILSGQVPSDAALRDLLAITAADTAAVSIADGAPEQFEDSAALGLRALARLRAGQLDFADGAWRLTGTADDANDRDAVLALIAADPAAEWSVAVDLPPAAVAAPAPAPQADEPAAAKVDIAACAGPISDFTGRNAILFQSGAALIAAGSATALDELAILLAACPDAVIHVEGHTDADGDARLNLGLSVARAEAVVNALVERGINPQRLYAVGYGEANPIADNATSAGKAQNRRIVVTVSDKHF